MQLLAAETREILPKHGYHRSRLFILVLALYTLVVPLAGQSHRNNDNLE